MKKLLAITLLSALFLSACSTTGEDLQGRFGTSKTVWTMTLSASSPSGAATVSAVDDFMLFEMKTPAKTTLSAGSQFRVDFATDSDLDTATTGVAVGMYDGSTLVGTGTLGIIDLSNPSEGVAWVTTTSAVTFKAGEAKTFTLTTDTAAILAEDAGVDDEVTASVEYNGKIVTGNALRY